MDKPTIIDGIDVSGCEHRCDTHKTLLADGHIKEFKNYCQITNDGCYAINCYYKQLKRKEQECEELKKELHKNFEEKDTLHLIIDRLLEASGYDTNTASAEDFEDVYEHMRCEQQQLDQLKAELEQYKKSKQASYEQLQKRCNELELENRKFKAELEQYKNVVNKLAGMQVILTNENGVPQLYENAKDLKLKQYHQTLKVIKRIINHQKFRTRFDELILQKCNEVLDEFN